MPHVLNETNHPMSIASAGDSQPSAVARSGALSLFGSVTSAVMGFLLIITLGRVLGAAGSGIVLQAVAAFTIALSITRIGMDTTAVWLLPRVLEDSPQHLRHAVSALLAPSLAAGCVGGLGLAWVGAEFTDQQPQLARALVLMAVFLPFATLMTVGLSITRGLGGVRPFVLIGSIAVPSVRPLLVVVGAAVAPGSLAAALAWAAPLPVAALVTLAFILRAIRAHERSCPTSSEQGDRRDLHRRIRSYAAPRSVATVLEQSMQWLDVLLIGVLLGPAAAGIYGAASRLVAAGLILSTALRIVVAPLYSRGLGRGDFGEVRNLYTMTTTWMVLFSTPIFVVLATFGATVLSLLGDDFRAGSRTLFILSIGLLTVLLAGNVQSILLMSGRSGLAAINKALALGVTLVGIVLLTPRLGIEGAALAWSVGMALDAALAAYQVHQLVGVRLEVHKVMLALGAALVSTGLPALALRFTLGDTPSGLILTMVFGAVLLTGTGVLLRSPLELIEVFGLLRRRRTPGTPPSTD